MAKRKLSPEQRIALRAELKKSIGGEQKTADVLRAVAKKYGITTITARWYLNSVDGIKKAGRRGPGRPPGRKPGRPAGTNGSSSSLIKAVNIQADNANAAKKLVPRWQALVEKESALRLQVTKLSRRLEATSQKATKLRSMISQLAGT
jgi:hypothetical protein